MKDIEIKRQRFSIDVYNQWAGLFNKGNWNDFTVIVIEGEYSPYKSSFEMVLGLLGIVFTFTYTYDFNFYDNLISEKDKIFAMLEAEHPGVEVIDPKGVLDELDKK